MLVSFCYLFQYRPIVRSSPRMAVLRHGKYQDYSDWFGKLMMAMKSQNIDVSRSHTCRRPLPCIIARQGSHHSFPFYAFQFLGQLWPILPALRAPGTEPRHYWIPQRINA